MAGKNKGCGVTIKVRLQIVASVLVYIARRLNTSMSRSGLLHFSGVRQKWPSAPQNRGGGKAWGGTLLSIALSYIWQGCGVGFGYGWCGVTGSIQACSP